MTSLNELGVSFANPISPNRTDCSSVAHPYFTRSAGELLSAHIEFKQGLRKPRPRHAAAKLGLRFEKKVLRTLQDEFGNRFGSQIPFAFQSLNQPGRTAIPDALLLSQDGWLLVVEIKLRHSADAYHQLYNFYLPIVRRAASAFHIAALEIVQYYDPRVVLPKQKALIASPFEAFSLRDCFHAVLIADKNGKWL